MRSSRRTLLSIVAPALFLAAPWIASAGITDPPPANVPIHVYSVPGALKTATLDTVVACTNVDNASLSWNVQFFDRFGTLLNPTGPTFGLNPGESLHIATGQPPSLPHDVDWVTGNFVGAARVVATSKKLLCTAFVIDSTSNPPVSIMQLPVIEKLKQKGD